MRSFYIAAIDGFIAKWLMKEIVCFISPRYPRVEAASVSFFKTVPINNSVVISLQAIIILCFDARTSNFFKSLILFFFHSRFSKEK